MKDPDQEVYRFGRFLLSPSRHALYLADNEVPLAPRSFEVLLYLARNSGRPVTKEEVLAAIWPDSFVEEANLAQHVFRLRKSLESEPGAGNLIRTLPGRGYQFTAEVHRESPSLPAAAITAAPFAQRNAEERVTGGIAVDRWRERTHVIVEERAPKVRSAPTRGAGVITRRNAALAAGLLVVGMAVAGWALWRRHVHMPPREYRQIVLAEFLNSTGDPTFDRTLKRALEVDLDQSPYMDVLTERDEVNTLLLMGRPSDTPIRSDIATEICERTNREVLLAGTISSLGQRYLLTLIGSDCNSGKRLAVAKAEATSREGVLEALDSVAQQVRKQLNESTQSLEDHEVPLRTATTPSLEALRAYSVGKYLQTQPRTLSARMAAFHRAIELDPNFAMAYRELAKENGNVSQKELGRQYYKKAFDLSGPLSTYEQHIIRAGYYAFGEQNSIEGIKEYQILESIYPRDALPPINIMDLATHLGLYDLSISTGEQALKRLPTQALIYSNLSEAYKDTNRFDEAERTARTAARVGTADTGLHVGLFQIAFARQDQASLARETQLFESDPDAEGDSGLYFPSFRANAAAALGKYREAERLFQNSYKSAQLANLPETADRVLLNEALAERALGFPEAARATLRRVGPSNVDPAGLVAAWAELDEVAPAKRFLAAQKGPSPDTLLTYEFIPRLQALLALQRRKPLEAIAALEVSRPYEMRNYTVPALRGEAYLQAGQPDLAVNEFKKILENPGIDATSVLYPLAHLGTARAYAMENKNNESRHEYEALFNRWRDADPELPVLKIAKQEYAQLKAN